MNLWNTERRSFRRRNWIDIRTAWAPAARSRNAMSPSWREETKKAWSTPAFCLIVSTKRNTSAALSGRRDTWITSWTPFMRVLLKRMLLQVRPKLLGYSKLKNQERYSFAWQCYNKNKHHVEMQFWPPVDKTVIRDPLGSQWWVIRLLCFCRTELLYVMDEDFTSERDPPSLNSSFWLTSAKRNVSLHMSPL